MKILKKHLISTQEADKLIEKYYDGYTNAEEERALQYFLSRNDIAEKYKPEQAIFGHFNKQKQKPRYGLQKLISWSVAAAAVLIFAMNIQNFSSTTNTNFGYIDGVKITDKSELKIMALASLTEISNDNNTVEECLSNLNNCDITSQLEMFSAFSE